MAIRAWGLSPSARDKDSKGILVVSHGLEFDDYMGLVSQKLSIGKHKVWSWCAVLSIGLNKFI